MKQRLIVAGIGIPVLLLILLACPAWATAAMCALLSAVGCYELMHAVGGEEWKRLAPLTVASGALAFCAGHGMIDGMALMAWVFLTVVYVFATAIVTHGKPGAVSFKTDMAGLFGALALPLGFASLAMLRDLSAAVVLAPFVGAFMSDTGAFFAGRAFGKRKLAPAVSPNKTVAGCIGGFAGSIVGMAVFHIIVKAVAHLDIGWANILIMGVLGSLFGQLGDLSFSVIKREFGIKDYGTIFPGHGGVLDRFDSVLFVSPAYLLFLLFFFA